MWRRAANVAFWLAASLYFGGLVGLGAFAAPAIFGTARDLNVQPPGVPAGLNGPNYLGGETFGRALARFAVLEMAAIVVMWGAIVLNGWRRQERRLNAARAVLLALLTAAVAYDHFSLTPRLLNTRTAWYQSVGTAGSASIHAAFDRLHHESETWGKVRVYLLLGIVVISAWGGTPAKKETTRTE